MKSTDRIIVGCLTLLGLGFVSNTLACTTDGWDVVVGETVPADPADTLAVGSPFGTPNAGIWRFEEECGASFTDTGYVQDDTVSHPRLRARFYVLPALTGAGGTVTIFKSFITISWDDSGAFIFDTQGQGGGDTTSLPATAGWNVIEIDHNTDADTLDIIVNEGRAQEATASIDGGAGPQTIDSVQLGLPDGLGGFTGGSVNVDSYVSQATLPIGPAGKVGDANGDGVCNAGDTLTVQLEILQIALAGGTPDCNFTGGGLNAGDTLCGQLVILGGGCP
jgi:hypothetical protein